jgi:uncharacterized protein YbjT (DUF2867 family)
VDQILVTGGTGTLGRIIVDELVATSHSVRVLSRRARSNDTVSADWVVGDLRKGLGVDDAVAGIGTIIHCASGRGDVASTKNLVHAATASHCSHVVFISIVGVDQIPLGYYRSKLSAERVIEDSGLPFTILRTTQFHNLIARVLTSLARLPAMPVPARTRFQPIDVREVAARLIELASAAPAGRVADMGGPEICRTEDLARTYLDVQRGRRPIVPIPLPGRSFASFRRGANLTPLHAVGTMGFRQFLVETLPNS